MRYIGPGYIGVAVYNLFSLWPFIHSHTPCEQFTNSLTFIHNHTQDKCSEYWELKIQSDLKFNDKKTIVHNI